MKRGNLGTAGVSIAAFVAIVVATAPSVAVADMYASKCAMCHGADGKGKGKAPALVGNAKVGNLEAFRAVKMHPKSLADADIMSASDAVAALGGAAAVASETKDTGMNPAEEKPAGAKPADAKPAEAAKQEGSGAELVGADACLGCHASREDFKKNLHAKAWPSAKGIDFGKSCETCHGAGSRHAEAAGDKSNPGYASVKIEGREGSEACLKCHRGGKQAHWEGGVHAERGLSCQDCHLIHKDNGKLLKEEAQTEVCFKCHANMRGEIAKMSHHPVKEGRMFCSSCHNPHGSMGPKMLVGNTVNETCYKCHADKRGPFLWEHRPVTEECTACHTPHGSLHYRLLVNKQPFLCQECHSNSRHPGTPYATDANKLGTRYQKGAKQAIYRACVNCHQNIHGSNHPSGKAFTR